MANQIIGGKVVAKDVGESIWNEQTKEFEARGFIRLTFEREGCGELDDIDMFDGDISDAEQDSFQIMVREEDAAFKKLSNPLIVKGATVLMVVTAAVRNASGFENLTIAKVAVDTEGKKQGFYKAPVYTEATERARSARVIHRF